MHGLRIKAVVHRAVAVADACMRAGRQRCTHIVASTLHGPQHVGPQCQVRRDGGRKRAAGAVRVVGLDTLVAEPRGEWISQMVALVIEWRGFGQYIVGLVDKMPALNEGCATKAAGEEHGSVLLRALGIDLVVEQRHGLGNVGRDDGRQREQATCERLGGILGNEASATLEPTD